MPQYTGFQFKSHGRRPYHVGLFGGGTLPKRVCGVYRSCSNARKHLKNLGKSGKHRALQPQFELLSMLFMCTALPWMRLIAITMCPSTLNCPLLAPLGAAILTTGALGSMSAAMASDCFRLDSHTRARTHVHTQRLQPIWLPLLLLLLLPATEPRRLRDVVKGTRRPGRQCAKAKRPRAAPSPRCCCCCCCCGGCRCVASHSSSSAAARVLLRACAGVRVAVGAWAAACCGRTVHSLVGGTKCTAPAAPTPEDWGRLLTYTYCSLACTGKRTAT